MSSFFQKYYPRHQKPEQKKRILIFLRGNALAIAISLFLTIVVGGIVRTTDTVGVCLNWPSCLRQFVLTEGSFSSLIIFDYLHHFLSLVSSLLILSFCLLNFMTPNVNKSVKRVGYLLLGVMILQILLGAFLNLRLITVPQELISSSHMILSLITLILAIYLTMYLFTISEIGISMNRWKFQSTFAKIYLFVIVIFVLMLISGLTVSRNHIGLACQDESGYLSFITCILSEDMGWLLVSHQLIVVVSGVAVSWLFLHGWRSQRSQVPVLVAISAAFILFWAQALLGIKMAVLQSTYLIVLHQVTAVSMWAALSLGAFFTGFAGRRNEDELAEMNSFHFHWGMVRDLVLLTKPIVVALLLVTTYAGMVIGGKAWPPFEVSFWTMIGGFMAAGGSGAINQFIDRKDDSKMQRTQKRPIPSGRLTPAEGLAFGVMMLLTSFYLMVAFVNLLSAILCLVGMIYYVLIYSIILKKTTVQNIVIGGGAGAIPPLVGWAAATGSLNIPSLFLFVVVFMWTPPHFWALALVRRNDYARAGVPMLPVIKGEKETRKQILIYTIELVIITLFLPVFGLGGGIYLIGAVILGLWLFQSAWSVWKNGGNKLAWKMYRYSSMYLAFIFAVLMVDALL